MNQCPCALPNLNHCNDGTYHQGCILYCECEAVALLLDKWADKSGWRQTRCKNEYHMEKKPDTRKPILVLDFDGVIHSYASGWKGADVIPDPPVEGAMEFLFKAVDYFTVAIYSSRSNQRGGIAAMKKWLDKHLREYWGAHPTVADDIYCAIEWPKEKPAAMVTIDDRAITFTGEWPDVKTLLNFKPWNKQ